MQATFTHGVDSAVDVSAIVEEDARRVRVATLSHQVLCKTAGRDLVSDHDESAHDKRSTYRPHQQRAP